MVDLQKRIEDLEEMASCYGHKEYFEALDIIKELQAELKKQSEWQPIKSAPKNEEAILLLTAQEQVVEGYWSPRGNEWISLLLYDENDPRFEIVFNGFEPTHWRPLPTPPTEEKND